MVSIGFLCAGVPVRVPLKGSKGSVWVSMRILYE